MGAGMDDAVHIEVQVIKFLAIGIWPSGIDWDLLAIDLSGLLFNDRADDFGLEL